MRSVRVWLQEMLRCLRRLSTKSTAVGNRKPKGCARGGQAGGTFEKGLEGAHLSAAPEGDLLPVRTE